MSLKRIIQEAQPPAKTCDNCKFAEPLLDATGIVGARECFGVPPTPVLVAARPDRFGRPEMQFELMRPRLPPGTRACSLHQVKIALA